MSLRAQSVLAGLATVLLGAAAEAQPVLTRQEAGGQTRDFAEPVFWRNSVPPDRLPIRERPVSRRLGFAGVAPPPDRRSGLTPYVSLSFTTQDSDQPDAVSNQFLATGFGLDYRKATATEQFFADYYVELTGAEGSGSGIDTHGGVLSYGRDLSARDRVSLFASYSSTRDLLTAAAPGLIAQADRFDTATLSLAYSQEPTRRSGFELGLQGLWQSTDDEDTADANRYGLTGRYWYFPSDVGRVDVQFDLGQFDIGANDETLQDVRLGYTADLGARLAASGYVGLLHTSADQGRTFGALGGALTATDRNWRLELQAERELIAIPGLNDPVLSDLLSATWEYRMGAGLLNTLSVENQRLEELGDARSRTRVWSVTNEVSYALTRKSWLWGRLTLVRETTDGVRTRDTQLSVGVSHNLR